MLFCFSSRTRAIIGMIQQSLLHEDDGVHAEPERSLCGVRESSTAPACQGCTESLLLAVQNRFVFLKPFVLWAILVIPLGCVIGVCCAFFLWSLAEVTEIRFRNDFLLFLLPLGSRNHVVFASVIAALCAGGVLVDYAYVRWTPAGAALNIDGVFQQMKGATTVLPARIGSRSLCFAHLTAGFDSIRFCHQPR